MVDQRDHNSVFVCYGDGVFLQPRDQIVRDAEGLGIFDAIEVWDRARLMETPEYRSLDKNIKDHTGSMYFWWKPFIIRKALEDVAPGGLVFYSDSGRYDGGFRLSTGAKYLIEEFRSSGFTGVLVPQFGSNQQWTRKECFEQMDCNTSKYRNSPQIQATFSMWIKSESTMAAITEWENCCRDFNLVGDVGEDRKQFQSSSFKAHRHDQSILTLVSLKHQLNYLTLGEELTHQCLKYLGRVKEVNVEFKKTEFVAEAHATQRVLMPLALKYMRRKLKLQEI
ncbi:hypothetical protein QEH52_11880 [Coraliomargarita sp. SDUM461003]|uniref:Uncharacterized protein n=2 Tax=Thalassobacterium maritimum TaxID=3041265 RepID=A0ABU1AVN9_9BACT|nr:hypothetical protein [Coraliomargarita sp. SDUM461003]